MTEILRDIFGARLADLSERELDIAIKVAEHFVVPQSADNIEGSFSADDVIEACKSAVEEEGYDWERLMTKKCRKRELVELRDCIFYVFSVRVQAKQETKIQMLGNAFDRTTMLHAVNCVRIWKESDARFRELFSRISQRVENHLTHKDMENTQCKDCIHYDRSTFCCRQDGISRPEYCKGCPLFYNENHNNL